MFQFIATTAICAIPSLAILQLAHVLHRMLYVMTTTVAQKILALLGSVILLTYHVITRTPAILSLAVHRMELVSPPLLCVTTAIYVLSIPAAVSGEWLNVTLPRSFVTIATCVSPKAVMEIVEFVLLQLYCATITTCVL